MCTIMTFSKAKWDAHQADLAKQVLRDATSNPHGQSMLLCKADGTWSQLRAQDPDVLITVLAAAEWSRVWIHSRFGTGGENSLENTHGFCSKGVWYMHNGFIAQAPGPQMPVDSMAIGKWIAEGTVYDKLRQERYANVFLVAPWSGKWTVVRGGGGGSLHTDGDGNYSTVAVAGITQPVPALSTATFDVPKQATLGWSRWGGYTPRSASTPTPTVSHYSPPAPVRLPPPEVVVSPTGKVYKSAREYLSATRRGETEYTWEMHNALLDAEDDAFLDRPLPRQVGDE